MLSVVIPVLDNVAVLAEQLEAVMGQELDDDWEVVVADNGSTDGTLDLVRAWPVTPRPVRLIDASCRRGPGAARNAGVEAARGDRIVFCDGDDVVAPGWLKGLVAGLDAADVVVGSLDVSTLNARPPSLPVDPWPRQFGYLPAGLGANMAVRRAPFEALGGFDEELLIGEDIDLCWRLQLAGYHLQRALEAVVAKRGRQAHDGLLTQSLGYGRSDAVLFRRFRDSGMPRGLWLTVRSWGWLIVHAPAVLHTSRRHQWMRVLFIRVGRLLGSVEQRVFYP